MSTSTVVVLPALSAAPNDEHFAVPLEPVEDGACEHDLGSGVECGNVASLAAVVRSPYADQPSTRVFCTRAHAVAELDALWGIGFDFPAAR